MIRLLLNVLLALLTGRTCWASTFGFPGDRLAGGNARCVHRRLLPGELGVAHRTLPCGALVALENPRTGAVAVARVVDRGPYGATMDDGSWGIKASADEPGVWRGCLDLSPALADALGTDGWTRVLWARVR